MQDNFYIANSPF